MAANEFGSSSTYSDEDASPQPSTSVLVGAKENRNVGYLRYFVFFILALVATAISSAVYIDGKKKEKTTFEELFLDLGNKLQTSFAKTLELRLGILGEFAGDITLAAMAANQASDSNMSWPFVVIPEYERRAATTARLSDMMAIALVPLLPAGYLDPWNEFASAHQQWRQEGIAIRTGVPVEEVDIDPIYTQMKSRANLSDTNANEEGPGPYFPTWQRFPAIDVQNVNVNLFSHKPHIGPLGTVMEHHIPVFPKSFDYWDRSKWNIRRDIFMKIVETYNGVYENDPLVTIFYPIFDSLDTANRTVIGVFQAHLYWKTYFENIFPETANVMIILENTCDQQYTYQVQGATATFLGHGDLHDERYDYLESNVKINADNFNFDPAENVCQYSLRAYPSRELEDLQTTRKPMVFSLSVAAVFVFTSLVFLIYDFLVERRQRVVLKSAMQSGEIVSSLFPEAIRERIYAEMDERKKEQDAEIWTEKIPEPPKSEAIAFTYPECTILFSDIVGFTKWSSKRNASDVFDLLEAIFGAFDHIAARRKVFKVETVGDCYVAATGLPEAQPDHAVIMTKFAQDCVQKLRKLTNDLMHRLGPDTAELSMRFGLHSGPVIAGVLKGKQSRFQIFGDTVNTAARMESNGQRECIHVSQSTADLLFAAGKEAWITKRSELVAAKGKGMMQTYWVTTECKATTATNSSGPQIDDSDSDSAL